MVVAMALSSILAIKPVEYSASILVCIFYPPTTLTNVQVAFSQVAPLNLSFLQLVLSMPCSPPTFIILVALGTAVHNSTGVDQ